MIKFFVTGDIHVGQKHDRYPTTKKALREAKITCLERCVRKANDEKCDFFVITGDMFDNADRISTADVKKVVSILATFEERVIVLPGNHDYYTGDEKCWKEFKKELNNLKHNITLITEFKELEFDVADESVTFYPAFCQMKHSATNNLNWIRDAGLDDSTYHIGLAHGTLEGLSPDDKKKYFLMKENELLDIPMDAWFLGHTHIPYPRDLSEDSESMTYKVFNAGAPEQEDLNNNTEGVSFIITLEKKNGATEVRSRKYISGIIRYYDLSMRIEDDDLRTEIESRTNVPNKNTSIIRLKISGSVSSDQYENRQKIYDELVLPFMDYEIEDDDLAEIITDEKIRAEFADIGIAYQLLISITDSKERQYAYRLVKEHIS